MFFTIGGQKIEIGSYCRKFPPAPRSAAEGPAPAPWAGPSAAVSYFFVQFLLQIFPYSRRDPFGNGLWDFPLFRPVSPGFSPENRSVFRPTFQRTLKTAEKFSPPVLSVHLSFSSRGHGSRRVQPYVAPVLFFITFHKMASVSFWNFVGFSRISTVRRGMPNKKSSYTLYDLPVFCPPELPQVPNRRRTSFRQPGRLLLFSWFLLGFSQGQRPRTLGIFPADLLGFPAGFMEKSWHFNYRSPKSSLSGGHRFLPVHRVSVVMFHATLQNRRVFRLQNFLLTNLLHCIQPFVSVGATDSSPILLRIIIPFCKLSPSVRHGQFFGTFSR